MEEETFVESPDVSFRLDTISKEGRENFLSFKEKKRKLLYLDLAAGSVLFLASAAAVFLTTEIASGLAFLLSSSLASWTVMSLGVLADMATTVVGTGLFGATEMNNALEANPDSSSILRIGIQTIGNKSRGSLLFPPLGVVWGIDSLLSASRNIKQMYNGTEQ